MLVGGWDVTASSVLREVLRAVAHSLPGGSIAIFDRSLRYLYAEGPGLAAVGLSSESLIGRTLHEVFPPSEVALVESHYRRAIAGEYVTFDLPVYGRVYETAASPLTAGTILVLVRDVTAERQRDRSPLAGPHLA